MAEQELFVVPLGHDRFSTIISRDGMVSIEQVRNLVGADGLGLKLVPVDNFTPPVYEVAAPEVTEN